jgi:hypothetical protein
MPCLQELVMPKKKAVMKNQFNNRKKLLNPN